MPKKIQEYGKAHLISVALPAHGETYTVISHESVINMSTLALTNAGFTVVEEEYRATADGQIAQGIYKLNYNSDPELSMMFAWTNSYNKQVRFKCGVGAYVNKTGTVMVCGDMGSWSRKHTGTADTETQDTIDEQVANAHMYYNQLCSDKTTMESITMNKRKQSQMLGILFAEYQILTTEQASMIRDQMKRPIHVFSNADSLWAFYNYVTTALQHSHPKTWMEDQRILHMFISEVNKFAPTSTPAPLYVATPIVTESEFVDPNQISILDQIAELSELAIERDAIKADIEAELPDNQVVQNGSDFDIDVHQSEEIILDTNEAKEDVLTEDELAHQLYGVDNDIEVSIPSVDLDAEEDEDWNQLEAEGTITPIVQYTDPVGNTFEAPVVIDDFAEEDNFDLDFADTEEEPGDTPDFF